MKGPATYTVSVEPTVIPTSEGVEVQRRHVYHDAVGALARVTLEVEDLSHLFERDGTPPGLDGATITLTIRHTVRD